MNPASSRKQCVCMASNLQTCAHPGLLRISMKLATHHGNEVMLRHCWHHCANLAANHGRTECISVSPQLLKLVLQLLLGTHPCTGNGVMARL